MPSRDELISALNSIASQLGETPTAREFTELSEYSHTQCQQEFGTWNNGLDTAGLKLNQNRATNNTCQDFIEDLKHVADIVDRVPRRGDMDQHGEFNPTTYQQWLPDNDEKSRWSKVLKEAGFDPHWEIKDTREFTCEICGETEEIKEYQPKRRFCSPQCHGKWREGRFTGEDNWCYNSIEVTCANCGHEWDRAKNHVERNENHFCSTGCMGEWISENNVGENHPRYKGGSGIEYGQGWNAEKRESVRKRDNYCCQSCGKTQAVCNEMYGKRLAVHHIIPADKFDNPLQRNAKENLVSLCMSCHRKWEGIPLRPKVVR